MSMFQPDDTTGAKPAYKKPAEQASFRRALPTSACSMGTPEHCRVQDDEDAAAAGRRSDRVYDRRGWTHLERRLGDLEAPATNSLDVAAWPTAEAERATMMKEEDKKKYEEEKHPSQKGTEYNWRRSAGRRSCASRRRSSPRRVTTPTGDPGTLGALIRDGGRGAPVSPAHFEEELKEKVFSFDSDRTVCAGLYRGVAEPLLADVEELKFVTSRGRRRTGATWAARSRAARSCGSCTSRHGRGRCGDGGVRRRARQRRGARAQGCSPSPTTRSATRGCATWPTPSRAARRPRSRGSTSKTRSATTGCATWATPSRAARRLARGALPHRQLDR